MIGPCGKTLWAMRRVATIHRDIVRETDHEKARYAWNYRRCRLTDVAPFSLQWSQDKVSLSLNSVNARIGRPLTATSIAGVHRRVYRRTYRRAAYAAAAAGVAGYGYGSYYSYSSPYYSSYYAPQPYSSYYGPVSSYAQSRYSCYLPPYASPPSRYSYYLPPFASVSSYDYLCGR